MLRQKTSRPRPFGKFIALSVLVHIGLLALLSLALRTDPITSTGGIIGLDLVKSNSGPSAKPPPAPSKPTETARKSQSKTAPARLPKSAEAVDKPDKEPSVTAKTENHILKEKNTKAAPRKTENPSTDYALSTGGVDVASFGPKNDTKLARPIYRLNPKPPYPNIAKRRGHQGTVYLKVRVTERGRVESVELERSSGYDSLDSSALNAVREWLFVPGKKNGTAVATWVTVPIDFRLRGG